jgi:glycine cleavage system H protein
MESHEWARQDGDTVTIGITSFAVEHLSDLTFISLPAVGDTLEKGDRFGEIESVKAVSELFSPVRGEVVEVNEALEEHVELVSEDPFEKGWMIKVRTDGSAPEGMDSAAYQKHVEAEAE